MKKQNGFALVPILLILILLSVVGFTGYYVYSQQTSKKTDSAAAVAGAAKTTPTSTPTANSTPSPTPTSSQKYLTIKEWGVSLPITDQYSDVVYKYGKEGISFQSRTFSKLSNNECKETNDTPYLGGITRYDSNGNSLFGYTEGPGSKATKNAVKVDNYMYDYTPPIMLFCSENDNNGELATYWDSSTKYLASTIKLLRTAPSQ